MTLHSAPPAGRRTKEEPLYDLPRRGGRPPVNDEWRVEYCDGLCCGVSATYELHWALTGNCFDIEAEIVRHVALADKSDEGWVTVLTRTDEIRALADSSVAQLEHINPLAPVGSRVILPWPRVDCVIDRDGTTSPYANPFVEVTGEALAGRKKEHCFFTHIRPDDDGWVAAALQGPKGTGIGVRSKYDKRLPFFSVWFSRTGKKGVAAIGLEPGPLPLGAAETDRLEMRAVLEGGEEMTRMTELYFLDTSERMTTFLESNGMSAGSLPKQFEKIGTDKKDWPTLCRAAGINGKR